jgi:energy-coupling factor transporter ATP-binding protein EcfA2
MVGRPVLLEVPKRPARPGAPVLSITNLEVLDERGLPAVRGLSLDVRAGEIVGVAGVEGNGQGELVEALTGLRRIQAGDASLRGASLKGLSPRAIAERGVSHVPADRWKRGARARLLARGQPDLRAPPRAGLRQGLDVRSRRRARLRRPHARDLRRAPTEARGARPASSRAATSRRSSSRASSRARATS